MTFRILQDHSMSTGVQSYALETLQEKIQGAEDSLRRELDNFSKQEVTSNSFLQLFRVINLIESSIIIVIH